MKNTLYSHVRKQTSVLFSWYEENRYIGKENKME